MSVFEEYADLNDEEYVKAYDFDTCWTKTNPDKQYEILDVAVGLIRFNGDITETAKVLGRNRRSVEGFILRQSLLRELQEDLEATFIDQIETKYKNVALGGDAVAQKFFLVTKGKNRGYVARAESTGPDGGPIPISVSKLDVSGLSSNELKALEKALMATQTEEE